MYGLISHNDALAHSKTMLGSLISIRSCGTNDFGDEKMTERLKGWDNYMLAFVEAGSLHINIEGENIIARKNDVALIPPGIPYTFFRSSGTIYHWMHFFGSGMIDYLKLHELLYHLDDPSDFLLHLKNLPIEVIDGHSLKQDACSISGMMILMALKKAITPYPDYVDDSYKAVSILSSSFRTEVTVEEYAETAGLSLAEFSKKVKEKTGMTPKQYIVYQRINNAKFLLKNHDMTLTEVADYIGYKDYRYFTRIFKKSTGLTPTEYKNKFINNQMFPATLF